jgi:hypothetical protein
MFSGCINVTERNARYGTARNWIIIDPTLRRQCVSDVFIFEYGNVLLPARQIWVALQPNT